jgi:hypothetical protein
MAVKILKFHKSKTPFSPKVENLLRDEIYPFAPGAEGKKSGGTHPAYAK